MRETVLIFGQKGTLDLYDPEKYRPGRREERIPTLCGTAAEMRPREIALDPLTALLLGERELTRRVP